MTPQRECGGGARGSASLVDGKGLGCRGGQPAERGRSSRLRAETKIASVEALGHFEPDPWAGTEELLALRLGDRRGELVAPRSAALFENEAIRGGIFHEMQSPNAAEETANAFQILGEVSLDDPQPSEFIEFWLYSHPSISERVRFAWEYDPWAAGQSPKYVR